ncbi:ArnT family glycosyltransferase [Mastigocladopsis repens]|uniref:ArnT family glycosyltransferase n=1 Tax=Mastigocladopsis repens TaxID=221287 RepID=UPI000382AECB|nr:glycosyltransferase family 39 protein [Mastigocladopsis repens]
MLYKLQFLHPIRLFIGVLRAFPQVTLLIWILPLLLFSSGQDSLMAHDEGLYAWRARFMIDSSDWVHPWSTPHHKTPGAYWLVASFYTLFGISEASGRLPSMITGILSVLLVYEIGKIILGKKVAWLAAAILSVEFLWLQYCRLGTPDVPMIFLVLLAIWSLLKAELQPKYRFAWCFLVGFSFGLGFLVRSFVIFLPMIALLPYLIGEHRRHRHLTNPMLYFGFVVGLIPTFIWLWLNWLRYGDASLVKLINFVINLGSGERHHNGLEFYFWNLPLKAFPWVFFSVFGLFLVIRRPIPRYQLILIGYPLVLFTELSFFSTRLSHYSLSLYPFIALLAAVGLNSLGKIYQDVETLHATSLQKIKRNLSYGFAVFSILLLIVGILAFVGGDAQVRKYAPLALALGLGWLILPLVWIAHYHLGKNLSSRYWLAGWLVPAWITLAAAGSSGFLGDYNPEIKTFLQQPAIAQVLHSSPINFVDIRGKTDVLLKFYTPHHGKRLKLSKLPASGYAWISHKQMANISQPHRVVGTVETVSLVQLLD